MIRNFKILLPLFFIVSLFTSYQTNANTDPKDKVLLTILKYVLTQGHYEPKEIDDAFSEEVFTSFIENLDPSKRYFLQSDIDEFAAFKHQIDDQINSEDLSFFYLVYNRLIIRTAETKIYYKEILANPFNFKDSDSLNVGYDKLPYAKDKNELVDTWYKQLKFQTRK